MIQGTEQSGLTLEEPASLRVVRKTVGQILRATSRPRRVVAGAVDLTHAPGAERAEDLVGTHWLPGERDRRPLLWIVWLKEYTPRAGLVSR
jgi:hypothetical protein